MCESFLFMIVNVSESVLVVPKELYKYTMFCGTSQGSKVCVCELHDLPSQTGQRQGFRCPLHVCSPPPPHSPALYQLRIFFFFFCSVPNEL